MNDEKRQPITFDEALAMLPDRESIHVFNNPAASVLVGADWDREKVLELLRTSTPELAGPAARAVSHGIVVLAEGRWFIETAHEWKPLAKAEA